VVYTGASKRQPLRQPAGPLRHRRLRPGALRRHRRDRIGRSPGDHARVCGCRARPAGRLPVGEQIDLKIAWGFSEAAGGSIRRARWAPDRRHGHRCGRGLASIDERRHPARLQAHPGKPGRCLAPVRI